MDACSAATLLHMNLGHYGLQIRPCRTPAQSFSGIRGLNIIKKSEMEKMPGVLLLLYQLHWPYMPAWFHCLQQTLLLASCSIKWLMLHVSSSCQGTMSVIFAIIDPLHAGCINKKAAEATGFNIRPRGASPFARVTFSIIRLHGLTLTQHKSSPFCSL